jgi:ketosteroid isomerase-like protein
MVRIRRGTLAALTIFALAACAKTEPAASDTAVVASAPAADAAADEQAIRAVNPGWFKAHQSGDVDALVAYYSDDAVISAPGAAPVRGAAGIREAFAKELQAMKAAGLTQSPGANPEFAVSGDLGYEWNTYTVADKSGKTIDTGKYLSVFGRRDGKWLIVRDIWNSDMAPASTN